jgi:Transposase IS116/IS110/IS902 family
VTFPSGKHLSSWVGACPGDNESAGVNYSHRSPKGNRHMRRVLNQTANAAVRTKGSIFEIVYRRSVPRLGHNQAIGAIAHRQGPPARHTTQRAGLKPALETWRSHDCKKLLHADIGGVFGESIFLVLAERPSRLEMIVVQELVRGVMHVAIVGGFQVGDAD